MGISTPGVGSGLPVDKIVEAIVTADVTPLQQSYERRLSRTSTEISALGQLKSVLANLKASLTALADVNSLYAAQIANSSPDNLSAILGTQAAKGTYQIEVQKLAQKQILVSAPVASDTTVIGNGTMTITFGAYSNNNTTFTPNADAPLTINIPAGNDNLASIKDAINNSKSGVQAAIVQDGGGYRLSITSKQTGQQYAMKISGNITALNYDPTTNVNNMTETMAAQDSVIKLNGLTLTQSTNELKNAISGVTLNLNKAEIGKTVTVTVSDQKSQVGTQLNDFIKKYNDTINMIYNLTGYNAEAKKGGAFQGDPQFRAIKMNLTKLATYNVSDPNSKIKSLGMIGVKIGPDGQLSLDQKKFQATLDNNYEDLGVFFAKTGRTTDPGVNVNKIDLKVKAGTYDINVTEFTPGTSMTGTIGGLPANSTNGKTLNGSDKLNGLSLNVISGTTGNRGTITVNDGIAVKLSDFLDTYLADKGDLAQRSDQLNKQMKQLDKDQLFIKNRVETLQTRYYTQYSKLDVALSQMKASSDQLSRLLAATSQKSK